MTPSFWNEVSHGELQHSDQRLCPRCRGIRSRSAAGTQGKSVVTLEGLGSISAPHPVQAAFIKEQVPQCGYCTSGIIMSAAALLAEKPKPTEEDVRSALDGNLCRCGTHVRVMRAVMAASGQGG